MIDAPTAAPRRVLIVCRSLPCHVSGGLEFHVVDQAVGLARAGLQVSLLSTPVPAAYRSELKASGVRLEEVSGVTPGLYSLGYLRKVGATIKRLHTEHHFDLIHAHEFGFGFAQFGNGLERTRIALTVHGTITTETPLHPDVFAQLNSAGKLAAIARFGRRYFFAPWWHRAVDRANVLLVDSDFTRRELERIRPNVSPKIRLVPLSMDMGRYPELDPTLARRELNWPESGKGTVLLTVGRLEWQKGHEIALRALAKLPELNWRYVVIGSGRELARLAKLAHQLGIRHRVEFMGRVSDEVKAGALAGADLFLWPERTHPAFGLAGLESLVMGTPVAAARRGAIPEILDEASGIIFDANDPDSMAEAIRHLLMNPSRLMTLRSRLRERTLERMKPNRMIQATLDAYW